MVVGMDMDGYPSQVKKQLVKKYGQDFAAAAARNIDGCVNERVIQKLSVQPPSAFLVVNYMKEIAKQFKVEWEPDEHAVVDPLAPIPAPTGLSVASAGVSGPDYVALYTMVRWATTCLSFVVFCALLTTFARWMVDLCVMNGMDA